MAKSIPEVVVNIKEIYKTYTDQLSVSDKISGVLINQANISSSGNELEIALREILKKLLPTRVKVSHGHVVDKELNLSYQQDIIISDDLYSTSIIKTLDGTEIFPFESIYATGELKRRWSQKKLKEHIKSIKRSKKELIREKVAPNLFETGNNFVKISTHLTNNPFRNPLFCFSFSVDFDSSYSKESISKILNGKDQEFLPNIIVILKSGVFVKVNKTKLDLGELEIILYPEFHTQTENLIWVFLRMEAEESLAYLIFLLNQHLTETILQKPSYLDLINKIVKINLVNIDFIEKKHDK